MSNGEGILAPDATGTAPAQRVLVLGGTSEIAEAITRELAQAHRCRVVLAGRDGGALEQTAQRLRDAGCESVESLAGMQAQDPSCAAVVVDRAFEMLAGVDIAILAVGLLGERGGLPHDLATAAQVLQVNLVGAGALLMQTALRMRERGGGTVVVLSSLAAERPRRTNVVYGASKAGLDALAQGLADALAPDRVRVMVVRPGFVRTRMTAGLTQPPLACSPEAVARATVRGLERGAQTVWAPASLRWVALTLALLPRPFWRRLSL